MIGPFSRHNNAVLMACCRQRFRPDTVMTNFVILILILTVAVFFAANIGGDNKTSFSLSMLFFVYLIQGGVLMLGLGRVATLVLQERISGTLTFHRISPQSRLNQIIGFLLGAPALEWLMALSMTPIIILLALLNGLSMSDIIVYECSILFSALTAYSLALFFLLIPSEERLAASGSISGIGVLALGFLLVILFLPLNELRKELLGPYSPVCYGFIPYTFDHLLQLFSESNHKSTPWQVPLYQAFAIQIAVQLPLFSFFVWAALRKLTCPEHPPMSKTQAFVATMMLFALYHAELLNNVKMLPREPFPVLILALLTTYWGLGCIYLLIPNRLLIIQEKYGETVRNDSCRWRILLSDGASILPWMLGYACLTLVSCLVIVPLIVHSHYASGFPRIEAAIRFLPYLCVVALAQLFCFAGLNEVFRSGRFHRAPTLFSLMLIILWIVLPVLGLFGIKEPEYVIFWASVAFSPVFAVVLLLNEFLKFRGADWLFVTMYWLSIINFLMAALLFILAARHRNKLA